jgi:outer membrane protein assembly factor BamB
LETPTGPNNSIFYVVRLRGADGVTEWQYEDAGPSNFLEARNITLDSAGNPVVTGMGPAADALSAFTVVALNRDDGSVIWNLPIIGTTPLVNQGNAVVFNPTTSAVLAVGTTQNQRTSFDLTVLQITNGHEDWRQVINGQGKRVNRDDGAVAIATDPRRGGVAVAGYAQNTGTDVLGTVHDFRLVKIGGGGDVDWTYDFNDPLPHSANRAQAVAVSERGFVFGAGRTCNLGITSCFTVVRVGQSGKEIWRTIVRGDTPGQDEARAIVVDPNDGNVIVAGNVTLAGRQWAVLKLDAKTGDVLWSAPLPGLGFFGAAQGLALTSRGTVAVAANTPSGSGVIELATSTGEIRSSGLSLNLGLNVGATSVAFDASDGTVVVAGTSVLQNETRIMTVAKFDGGGNLVWSASFENALHDASLNGLAVEQSTGAVAITGGPTVIRLNADGSEAWRQSPVFPQAGNGFPFTSGVAFASDRVIVVGQSQEGTSMLFSVVSFDADGAELWRRTFPGTATFGLDSASAVTVDDYKGAIFAAGIITNDPTGPDLSAVGLTFDGTDLPASSHSSTEHMSR